MTVRRRIRSLAGFAAVITLLVLIAADTIHPGISLSLQDKAILISLISALLGIDLAIHQLPFEVASRPRPDQDGDTGGQEDD
ncbi:transmembrane domain protein [Halobacterium phage ChaoS9]|uniref:Transmembrane domain protein n=1 Tax=Halobacterium phage ChaoS9 TaxID=2847105 RepID=A0A481V9K1_9CAUD|nr:transmembrane domain protein [Halobacterium phage ChaoS9]QBI90085.1 transmembrane domain protein [Halobacterium phage ChaoS9]